MLEKLKQQIFLTTCLDLRSLALFRVGMGVLLILDILRRMRDLTAHYTDYGVLTRADLLQLEWHRGNYSLALLSGEPWFITIIFLLTIFFGAMIVVGYKTRLMTILGWAFLASIQLRNPVISNSGDAIFRLMIFWSAFLPTNARYSVDSALSPNENHNESKSVSSLASFAFIYQLLMMYFITALLKRSDVWFGSHSALHYAFNMQAHTTNLGEWLLNFPSLLKALTAITVRLELILPLIFFLPFFHKYIRNFSLLVFMSFHLLLVITLNLGLFPWTCLVYWIAVIPGAFWEYLDKKINTSRGMGQTLYYDRDCNFCRKSVLIIKEFLGLKYLAIQQVQSDERIQNESDKYNSWIFDDGEKLWNRYPIFSELVSHSPIFSWSKRFFKSSFMTSFGQAVYHFVSNNRKLASYSTKYIKVNKPINLSTGSLGKSILIYSLIIMTIWNIRTTNFNYWGPKIPKAFNYFAYALNLSQYWTMYAPYPTTHDGWYTFPGKLVGGDEVDAFRIGEKHTFDKPDNLYDSYIHQRWRKYLLLLWYKNKSKHRLPFGRYLCRRWNDANYGDNELETFKIFYMKRETAYPNEPTNEYTKELIWTHNCFSN